MEFRVCRQGIPIFAISDFNASALAFRLWILRG